MNKRKDINLTGLDMEATGARIRAAMKENGFNDRTLGLRMNISMQAVNRWRLGRAFPDMDNTYILLNLLNTKFENIFVPFIDPELEECAGQIFLEDYLPEIFDHCEQQ